MSTFYNDNSQFNAKWLRYLVSKGFLPQGDVDSRSVEVLRKEEVDGYLHAHFFAGIGGWPLAAQMADWPSTLPIWSASLPCQPFSNAGVQRGVRDKRHLWPIFARLVEQCRPPILVGEQVESKIGRQWLSSVLTDLEAHGYSVAAANLPAASVGAPHGRQRFFWCALAHPQSLQRVWRKSDPAGIQQERRVLPKFRNRHAATLRSRLHWDGPKPEFFALADGLPGRVESAAGYGNAIVPQVGAEFLATVLDIIEFHLNP
jgi:DNA (cytosine-5)-methyltransferase 1